MKNKILLSILILVIINQTSQANIFLRYPKASLTASIAAACTLVYLYNNYFKTSRSYIFFVDGNDSDPELEKLNCKIISRFTAFYYKGFIVEFTSPVFIGKLKNLLKQNKIQYWRLNPL